MQNMEGEEERGTVGEENSQKDAATERSQTPQLPSDRGSDDDDDKEDANYVTYEQVSDGIHPKRV